MRILQVGAGDFFSTYGGGQVYVKNVVDEMIRQGADIAVLSFVDGIASGEFRKRDYRGVELYEVVGGDFRAALAVVEAVQPDVIHAHSHKGWMCTIGEKLGIPVVVTAHHGGIVCPAGALMNCEDEVCRVKAEFGRCLKCSLHNIRSGRYWYPFMRLLPEGSYVKLGDWLSRRRFVPFVTPIGGAARSIHGKADEWRTIADKCTVLIAPCKELGEALVRNGLDESKLRVIGHGVNASSRSVVSEATGRKLSDGLFHFFFVGRICYVKGIHVLIRAFMGVRNPDVRLHLIGGVGNKGERRYEARMRRMSRGDSRIVWHGKVNPEKVYETIVGFDVALSPSIFMEAYGLNVAEGMMLGKPVLASRNGGAEMQIREGENGWLVPANDVAALRYKMEWIASERPRLDGETIRGGVKTLSAHVGELISLYEQTLSANLKC